MRSPWQIQKSVVFALFIRDLRTRFGTLKGGYVWFLVEPVAHVLVLTLVFSYLRQRALSGIELPVFLASGVIPFLLFKTVTMRVMGGIESNRGLFAYKQVKPIDAFVARTLLDTLASFSVFLIFLTGLAWLGYDVPMRDPLVVLVVYLALIVMGLGLGMVYCVINHYLPESSTFLRLSLMPLYILSGVMFPVAGLPAGVQSYLMWNPLLHAVELLRSGVFAYYPLMPGVSPLFVAMSTLLLLASGLTLYWNRRFELLAR